MEKSHLYTTALDAETKKCLTICLFTQVKNAAHLRKMLMSGDLKCCLMKAHLICDPFQVVVAANKAAVSEKFSKLITKSVHTEILYNLSVSKNITQSLINFGIADSDSDIVLGLIHDEDEETKLESIVQLVEGQTDQIKNLCNVRDVEKIKKVYKIDDVELKVSRLLDSVISRICVKDFISVK